MNVYRDKKNKQKLYVIKDLDQFKEKKGDHPYENRTIEKMK